jgi:hemerythrin-like domain-containing protein
MDMSELIEELKKEHVALVDVLDKVWELGIDGSESRNRLLSAKEAFIAHLKKEEQELYPPLRKAAESDRRLHEVIDSLAKDTEEISSSAIAFFDKYSRGGSGLEFKGDFSSFYARITIRIQQEEDMLYAEYEKLKQ